MHPCDAMEQLTKQLGRFESNDEFIKLISGASFGAVVPAGIAEITSERAEYLHASIGG